jgi:hypothetical protein
VADLQAKLNNCTSGSKALQDQNAQLLAQILVLTNKLTQAEAALANGNAALKLENAAQAKRILELENELKLQKAANAQLRADLDKLKIKLADELKRCMQLKQDLQALITSNRIFLNDFNKFKEDLAKLKLRVRNNCAEDCSSSNSFTCAAGHDYQVCFAQNVRILKSGFKIQKVNGLVDGSPEDILELIIEGQMMKFLPVGLGKTFPNLEKLVISNF